MAALHRFDCKCKLIKTNPEILGNGTNILQCYLCFFGGALLLVPASPFEGVPLFLSTEEVEKAKVGSFHLKDQ